MFSIYNRIVPVFASKKYYTNYYKRTIRRYKDIEAYLTIYKNAIGCNTVLDTNQEITFSNNISFGANIDKIKRELQHSYRIVPVFDSVRTLFSEIKIQGIKFILEMHFFKDQLVCYRYLFNSLDNVNYIRELVQKKYLKSLPEKPVKCLVDSEKNYIYIDVGVFFSISYMTTTLGFLDYLLDKRDNQKRLNDMRSKHLTADLLSRL